MIFVNRHLQGCVMSSVTQAPGLVTKHQVGYQGNSIIAPGVVTMVTVNHDQYKWPGGLITATPFSLTLCLEAWCVLLLAARLCDLQTNTQR